MSPVRVVVNKHSTVEEVEVLDVLYAVNAKKKNQSSNEAELPADAVPPIKGSSTISIADLLEIVKGQMGTYIFCQLFQKHPSVTKWHVPLSLTRPLADGLTGGTREMQENWTPAE